MARTQGRRPLAAAALLGVLLVAPRAARAEPEPAWARAIRDGVVSQDRDISRTSIGSVVTMLENKSQRDPDDLVTLYLLARAYGKKGAAKDAIQTYGEVLQKNRGNWFAWRDRGLLSFRPPKLDPTTGAVVEAGEDRQAVADLTQAVALKPDFVQALQDLAEIHLRAQPKRPAAAIPLLEQALNVDPGLDAARLQLAQAMSAAGKGENALAVLGPLLSKQPHEPRVRMVQGAVLAALGRVADAQRIFKQLALDNPASPEPLREWLRVTRQAPSIDRDETVWFLEQLRRLTPGEAEKRRITEGIANLKSAVARPAGGPPTAAQVAAALRGADAAHRTEALRWLSSKSPDRPRIEGDLLAALIERVDPVREPLPENRLLALRAFEDVETSGSEAPGRTFSALLRASLFDPDPAVRVKVPDVLAALRNRAAIPALVPYAKKAEVADAAMLAVSARNAVYVLANAEPPFTEDAPDAQARAFAEWWTSPERAPLKRAIVQEALASTDPAPEKVLIPIALFEADPAVYGPAYRALVQIADTLPKDPPTVAPEQRALLEAKHARDAWLRTIPRISDADLSTRETYVKLLLPWVEKQLR